MGTNDFWLQLNNGQKHLVKKLQSGVRKEQVDKKFHNLFDAYDTNGDGTLENEEISGILKSLKYSAGNDNILSSNENKILSNLFSSEMQIKNADFMGFVKSVSEASSEIASTVETTLSNGNKEIIVQYKNGETAQIICNKANEILYQRNTTNKINTITDETNTAKTTPKSIEVPPMALINIDKYPHFEDAMKNLIDDGTDNIELISKKYKIPRQILEWKYCALFSPKSDLYGDFLPHDMLDNLREYASKKQYCMWRIEYGPENNKKSIDFIGEKIKDGNVNYLAYQDGVIIDSDNILHNIGIQGFSSDNGYITVKTDFVSGTFDLIQYGTKQYNQVNYWIKYDDIINSEKDNKNIKSIKISRSEEENLSNKGKEEIALQEFLTNHYIENLVTIPEVAKTCGIVDLAGIAISDGAGLVWSGIKKPFGSNSEYTTIAEKLPEYKKGLQKAYALKKELSEAVENPGQYFMHSEMDKEKCFKFRELSEQYQIATVLNERLNLLKQAQKEVKLYLAEQNEIQYSGPKSEGFMPGRHIEKAQELLLQCLDGKKENVDLLLDKALYPDENDRVVKAISALYEETEKQYKTVLNDTTLDKIQAEYKTLFKEVYKTDFFPEELTEKLINGKAVGGMAKLAAITIVSILVTRSPIMTQIMGAATGSAEATGAAANLIRTLTARYGATTVHQGIKLAMTTGTLALDVGGELLNQITDNREGIQWGEVGEKGKSSAKYIFFGAYIGSPLAQAVSKQLGKIGATKRMFEGGVTTVKGAIKTTTVSGERLVQNLMKGRNKVLTTGGAFLTDVAAFTGLEIVTEGIDPLTAGQEQTEMLGKLKIMNHFIEYILGGKVHAGMSKAKMDAAIEKSGVKKWQFNEIITPSKSMYEVQIKEGLPPIRFKDGNELATTILEKFSLEYEKAISTESKPQKADVKSQTKVRTTPEVKAETKQKTTTEVRTTPKIEAAQPQPLTENKAEIQPSIQKVKITTIIEDSAINSSKMSHMGTISAINSNGENVGRVMYEVQVAPDGTKTLHFEGLESYLEGQGVGTKLIGQLIKLSNDLGAEGRINAKASLKSSVSGKLTNLGFYYKMGFRATDSKIDAQIREILAKGEEIPIELNLMVEIEYTHTKAEIDKAVNEIRNTFDEKTCEGITEELKSLGIDKIGEFSFRAKSESSLYDKILNEFIDNPETTIEKAKSSVRDGFGARSVVQSGNFAEHPEVKKLAEQGNMDAARQKAIELQSEELFEVLKENMTRLAESNDGLKIMRISNYNTADGKFAYLTADKYAELREYASRLGVDFSGNEIVDVTDPRVNDTISVERYSEITKTQPSGYPALQINFITKGGHVIEWQYRGDRVNTFAEGEHISYDLRTGKNIIGRYPELKPLYDPIKELFIEENMPKSALKEYNRYWCDYYEHLRKLELGFDSKEPPLSDYGNGFKFDKRLEARNMVYLHELGEAVKNGKISSDDAVIKFENNINNTSFLWKERAIVRKNELDTIELLPPNVYIDLLKSMGFDEAEIKENIADDANFLGFGNQCTLQMIKTLQDKCFTIDYDNIRHGERGKRYKYVTRKNIDLISKYVDLKNDGNAVIELLLDKDDIQRLINYCNKYSGKNKLSIEEAKVIQLHRCEFTPERLKVIVELFGERHFNIDYLDDLDIYIKNPKLQNNPYVKQGIKTLGGTGYVRVNNNVCKSHYINKATLSKCIDLQKLDYDDFTSFTLSCINKCTPQNAKSYAAFIENLKRMVDNSFQNSIYISEYINNLKKIDIDDFCKYLNKIDINKIKKLAPKMNNYNAVDILTFLEYHYKNGTIDFSNKDLTLSQNLTEFLANNYLDYDAIIKLFATFPNTTREIGKLPEAWVDKDKEPAKLTKQVYDVIEVFRKNVVQDINQNGLNHAILVNSINEGTSNYIDKFAESLTNVLGKETSIKVLGNGAFGIVYKIEVHGAKPVVVKIFHNKIPSTEHGQHVEPQAGPFINKNSSGFSHFYFGKVASQYDNDGFLVMEFLDKTTTPIQSKFQNNPDYRIISDDAHANNCINGMIIDYGAIRVIYKNKPPTVEEILQNIDKQK